MRETLAIRHGMDGFHCLYRTMPPLRQHRHEELEFNLMLHGTCTYLVAERRYDLGRGALLWLFPDQEHVLLKPSADCEMRIVVIRQSALRRMAGPTLDPRLLERSPAWLILRRVAPQPTAVLDRLIGAIDQEHPARGNVALVHATLEAWHAFLAAEEGESAAVEPAVDLAARLLSRADAPADLATLAARVGRSPGRLSRAFRAQLGVGIADYRNRVRLERFLTLHGPSRTMLAAAMTAGFGSYPQFHRVFRQMLGVTPRAYLAGRTCPTAGREAAQTKSRDQPPRHTRRG